ncbi:VWA domain-containing protein [Roseibium sp. MMSF_3544]|uniref:VWA domain-containing protein n=1 Tax=unclassified Roseibium TaxID=2629323 RepID=UPI00273F81C1|nr:VWA domain-containing protein [Roseibium sp. MMSF_3544]
MAKTRNSDRDTLVRQSAGVPSAADDISAFLEKAKEIKPQPGGGGRLIFALDATMSRQATWDRACHIQAEMFQEAGKIGGLKIKLVYFRGFGECRASRWFEKSDELARAMSRISVQGGRTQIGKVLSAALSAAADEKIAAVVYVGDCMEEDVDMLCDRAGQLGLLGVPMFLFQEGRDSVAESAFREMARLTNGAYCPFDAGSAQQLAELLKAVAVFASGGHKALKALDKSGGRGARLLLEQIKRS